MAKNIYFFAYFGDMTKLPIGGGTTAARRLLSSLVKMSFNVSAINRTRPATKLGFINRIKFYMGLLIDPIILFFRLLFSQRKESVFLYMSYAGSLILFDLLITLSVVFTRHNKIYFLAGGGTDKLYKEGTCFYRWLFGITIKMYDEIMCEGERNVKLVKSVAPNVKVFYLPNFTEDGFAPDLLPEKPQDKVNIMYFGRIDESKNVVLGIRIFDLLCNKYKNVYYTIVGGGHADYELLVEKTIAESPNNAKIVKLPRSSHGVIADIMKSQHIFLFPSNEKREGHSNALNEAMSWGLVPIVSNNNFLSDIVGDSELVVNGFAPEDYAKCISRLIDENLIREKSFFVYNRVKCNFTQSVVEGKLQKELLNVLQ